MWSWRGTRAVALGVLVAAGGATSAVALTSDDVAKAQAEAVNAFPAPGTRAAQRGTEISLRGVAPGAVGTVTVTGSVSGAHQGTIQPHTDGRGASFVPAGPFTAGERVTVSTALDVRGAQDGDYGFTILRGEYETGRSGSDRAVPRPRAGTYHSYRSDPSLKAPRLVITRRRPGRAPGHLVLNTGWDEERPRPEGLLIADDRGRPVYFKQRTAERKIFDVAVQRYQGRPVITYWEGRFAAGWGYGDYVVLDESYREILRVEAKSGYRADIHDMRITPEDTLLVQVYNRVAHDLRGVGGTAQRRAARQRDPGDRPSQRPPAVRVAQPRRDRAARELRPARARRVVRLLPPQLDGSRAGRRHPHLRPQHLRGVRARPRDRRRELAAGRQAQRLPARPRSTLLPPARRTLGE